MQCLRLSEDLRDDIMRHRRVQMMDLHEQRTLAQELKGLDDEALRARLAELYEE